MKNKRIILFSPGHIGDFIWLTSVFSMIKAYDKNIKIILFLSKSCKNLIEENLNIDTFVVNEKLFFNKNKIIRYIYKILFVFDFFKYIKLFKSDYLLISSTPPGFFIMVFKKIYKIKNIIYGRFVFSGSSIGDKYLKYCSKVIDFEKINNIHIMLRLQLLIRACFNTYNLSIPHLPSTKYLFPKIKGLTKDSKKYKIVFCTRGAESWKFLDMNFLKSLILKINNSYNATFFVIGSGKEMFNDAINLKKELPNIDVRDFYNKTSLLELIELIRNIDLLISIDTGVVHIAAAVNTPVISLCGPTLPVNSAPISHKGITLYSQRECSPCDAQINVNSKICKDMKCLKDITVDMAFNAVEEILK